MTSTAASTTLRGFTRFSPERRWADGTVRQRMATVKAVSPPSRNLPTMLRIFDISSLSPYLGCCQSFLTSGVVVVAYEEKRAWIMLVVTICGYATYLVLILGQTRTVPLTAVPYVAPMLWTIGGAIVVTVAFTIATAVIFPQDANKKDRRDREIGRFGEHVGQSFVVIGAVAARRCCCCITQVSYFWIANAVYLAFALSSILGSVARIFAYRRGF